jgi:hypothetical protein
MENTLPQKIFTNFTTQYQYISSFLYIYDYEKKNNRLSSRNKIKNFFTIESNIYFQRLFFEEQN